VFPGASASVLPAFQGADKLHDGLARLFDGGGRILPSDRRILQGRSIPARFRDHQIQVVIHLEGVAPALERDSQWSIAGVRVAVESARDHRIQGWVGIESLPQLAASPEVRALTAARPPRSLVTTEGLVAVNANTVHAADIKGQGVRIGVVDIGFQGYQALLGTELPATVTTRSFYPGNDITGGGETHGTGVAEILHDMAPSASLYFVNIDGEATFMDAVDWLASQQVDVISTSIGSEQWEGSDGTGPTSTKASAARDAGIMFFAAAGNGGDAHYRATFTPSSLPEFHQFYAEGGNIAVLAEDGEDLYYIPQDAPIFASLVWDNWGLNNGVPSSTIDYDLWLVIFDEFTDPGNPEWAILETSETVQNGSAFPREWIGVMAPMEAIYGLVVLKKNVATANVPFDIFVTNIFQDLPLLGPELQVPAGSVLPPCVGEKVLCVGATSLAGQVVPYSAQGPAHPNPATGQSLPKPDLVAPTGVSTATYGASAFGGTSAAAPHAAGVGALYLQRSAMDADEAESALKANALDILPAGRDNISGFGRVRATYQCDTYTCPDDGLSCTASQCDAALGCSATASGVGCFIEGTCHDHGAMNPANPCEACDQASPTVWSHAAEDSTCPDDGNECTIDVCRSGVCDHLVQPNGTACSADGLDCTSDSCQGGTCTHTVTTGCLISGICRTAGQANPDNPCEQCAPANRTQWTRKVDGSPCEDGLFCTTGDMCADGVCASGLPRNCAVAGDACNTYECLEAETRCTATPVTNGTTCQDDGNACTLDVCTDGTCDHPTVPNDCEGRQCGPSPSGCHACGTCPAGFGCDSGGVCTDLCQGITCPECQGCEGGFCVSANEGGACTSDGNACTRNVCATGSCTHPPATDGTACNDSSLCTRSDMCFSGTCVGGDPVVCTALDSCHNAGNCDPSTGLCSNPPAANGTPCSDGDPCTLDDECQTGACVSGTPVICPDPAECRTRGTCDPANGQCSDPPEADGVACASDGLACTRDQCQGGACDHVLSTGCLIAGNCVANGAVSGGNSCLFCNPASPTEWTTAVSGTPCGSTLSCFGGILTLADQCDQQGICVDAGTRSCSPYVCADSVACATTCQDDQGCAGSLECIRGACRTNAPPVADAGEDQIVDEGDEVTLDGTASSDPDSDTLSWSWTQEDGPEVVLVSSNSAQPSFIAPEVDDDTTLTFSLVVNDGTVDSLPATVAVTVRDQSSPPDDGGDAIPDTAEETLPDAAVSEESLPDTTLPDSGPLPDLLQPDFGSGQDLPGLPDTQAYDLPLLDIPGKDNGASLGGGGCATDDSGHSATWFLLLGAFGMATLALRRTRRSRGDIHAGTPVPPV
jgi:MYXO-CTERM domain-containing protein